MLDNKIKRKLSPFPSLLNRTTDLMRLTELYRAKVEGVITKPNIDRTVARVTDLVKITGKTDIREVTEDDFDFFKQVKLGKSVKNISINSYYISFMHFWAYFGIELRFQFLHVDRDRLAKLQNQIITNTEFVTLLEVIDTTAVAFKAAVAILWETGLRVGENSYRLGCPREGLLGLNWCDIDFQKCVMEVRLKGGKTQRIPLGKLSEQYLRELKESGNYGKIGANDPVFVSSTTTAYELLPLPRQITRLHEKCRHTSSKEACSRI